MRFKDEVRVRLVDKVIDGVSHQVRQKYTERVPVLPRDWDAVAIRAASGLVLAITMVAIVWSTVSIGELLQGGVGYAAAALFDISWLTVLVLEWLARFSPDKRTFPRTLGWVLVAIAAGAIFWHGYNAGSVALATVGALVSIVSKLLWLAVFKHIDKELTEEDQDWVAAELSRANATLALAAVRRQVAAAEARARLELLAAEKALSGLGEQDANTIEQATNFVINEVPATAPLTRANTVREPAEPTPSIAELARQQLVAGASNKNATDEILRRLPDANPKSVEATVRREARRLNSYL